MPFLSGGSLRQRMRAGRFSIGDGVALGITLARAIGRAHAAGIVHRDLKPENVLFDGSGRPLIADLGLAKHFRSDAPGASHSVSITQAGEAAGTVGYMAPEQIGTAKDVGPQADVFALGAIVYECLAGRAAFEGDSIAEVMVKVASGYAVPIRSVRGDVPRWLARVLDRALARDAPARWQDGEALARAFEDGPRLERRRSATRLAVSLAVLVLAAGAWAIARRTSAAPPPPPPQAPAPPPSPSPAPSEPSAPPAWWRAIAPEQRPRLPLPRGVAFGRAPGEYLNEKDGSVLLYVLGGKFTVGENAAQDETIKREVTLDTFFIGKYEVTNAQFARFVQETGYVTSAEMTMGGLVGWGFDSSCHVSQGATWRSPEGQGPWPPDHPVVQVGLKDAVAYCAWAGLRLPSDPEWEWAAGWDPKLKRLRRYPWGDELPKREGPKVANVCDASAKNEGAPFPAIADYDDGFVRTAPVGSFPAGASPIGALDMGGNVREWTSDIYGSRNERTGASEEMSPRCVRGSSFASTVKTLQTWYANDALPVTLRNDLGFRVARAAR
jgi:serine/threonine-protein kinase